MLATRENISEGFFYNKRSNYVFTACRILVKSKCDHPLHYMFVLSFNNLAIILPM